MAEIKRPHYFTSQFLVEGDFNDEQAYHVNMRRRLNRVQHTYGVADGNLGVTFVDATHVQVGAGTAIDKDGREIVLEEPVTYRLNTAGGDFRDVDVNLTIRYREEPIDDQGGGRYKRTAERPELQDATAVPPSDGSVMWLARIRLNASGIIAAHSSIDTTVRTLLGARLKPKSVREIHLENNAVTLAKLAQDARPPQLQGANAITVTPEPGSRTVTVGENHSARINNPHATTALQIDTEGGMNRIVAQINAGSGVIARSRVETGMVTGVVTFTGLDVGEQFTGEIDPGLGAGTVCVQLAIDEGDMTVAPNYLKYTAEVDRTSGRFRISVTRLDSSSGPARVRWYAFKPTLGTDSSVSVGITVQPAIWHMPRNSGAGFIALVTHSTNQEAGWLVTDANGNPLPTGAGSVFPFTGQGTTYSSFDQFGTYYVTATSTADHSKFARAQINVTAQVMVNVVPNSANVRPGGEVYLIAEVINNAADTRIEWIAENSNVVGGSVEPLDAGWARYIAPTAPGTYIVIARSVAHPNKSATCAVTVVAPGSTAALGTKIGGISVADLARFSTKPRAGGKEVVTSDPMPPAETALTAPALASDTKTPTSGHSKKPAKAKMEPDA